MDGFSKGAERGLNMDATEIYRQVKETLSTADERLVVHAYTQAKKVIENGLPFDLNDKVWLEGLGRESVGKTIRAINSSYELDASGNIITRVQLKAMTKKPAKRKQVLPVKTEKAHSFRCGMNRFVAKQRIRHASVAASLKT
jgi:hypothetical protein